MSQNAKQTAADRQNRAPLAEALLQHIREDVTPFHVPAHKHGKGTDELTRYFGQQVMSMDINSMSDVDDLANPNAVIDEAQRLTAELFGAQYAHFLINGTTSGIHAMMISRLRPGDRIILPRNAHKSAFSGLVASGAVPVYARVEDNTDFGIATTVSVDSISSCFERAPQTAALFIINPTYYGFASDLQRLIALAREWDASVLVDEAHGGHMYFHDELPVTAMQSGADMSAVSMHKTCGSLTQSSLLLLNSKAISNEKVINTLNMFRSTSASYLLMASLDLARKQLAMEGRERIKAVVELARYAREKINQIEGLHAFGQELTSNSAIHSFDETKLSIFVRKLGATGFEIERRLRQEYNIQVELADLNVIMAMITIGDTQADVDRLIAALEKIASRSRKQNFTRVSQMPDMPDLIVIPRDAFYSHQKSVALEDSVNEISGEMVMSYPPGIPVICPGERITRDIIDYINILKEHNCHLQGTADPFVNNIRVLGF
ncbi:MAG: aminotransferase class I/II-fold pyridoxal phosphate-dependent enzyme [Leptospiraceae bacterium]|nr:aminotransferase class I/II-fold pyridoxal phosphate-dependent enzyme [Leptospiraceae bacterium]